MYILLLKDSVVLPMSFVYLKFNNKTLYYLAADNNFKKNMFN